MSISMSLAPRHWFDANLPLKRRWETYVRYTAYALLYVMQTVPGWIIEQNGSTRGSACYQTFRCGGLKTAWACWGRPTGYLGCACGAHMGDCSARYRSSQAKSPWTSATELILESSGLVAPESIMMLTGPVPSLPFAVRRASYSDCTG